MYVMACYKKYRYFVYARLQWFAESIISFHSLVVIMKFSFLVSKFKHFKQNRESIEWTARHVEKLYVKKKI